MPQVTDPGLLQQLEGGTAQQSPGVIYGRPKQADPLQLEANDRANRSESRAETKDQFSRQDEQFNRMTDLGKQFTARTAVKNYNLASPAFETALQTEATPAGDLNLIFAFAKVLDPDSVVREGEAAAVQNSDTVYGQTVARLRKEIGQGGTFSDTARENLRREMKTRMGVLAENYEMERVQFKRLANRAGVKPIDVVGNEPDFTNIFGREGLAPDVAARPLSVDVPDLPEQGTPGQTVQGPGGVIVAFYDQDGKRVDIDTGPNFDADGNPIPVEELNQRGNEMIDQFHAGIGDVAQGVGETLGIVGNPLNAGINMALGTDLSTDLGATFREATGAPENKSPLAAAINRGGASVLTGTGAANALARGANLGGNAVVNALAQQPIQQGVAGSSAGAASELTRQAGGGPLAQMGAGLVGGVGGFAGANRIAQTGQPKNVNALAQAFERQSVDPLPAHTGGTATRSVTAGARQGIVSEIPIAKAVSNTTKQTEAVRNRAAAETGTAIKDKESAGEVVRKAAEIYSKRTGEIGSSLYTRAFNRADGYKSALPTAVKAADEELAKIAKVPGGKDSELYKEIKGLRDNMAKGKFEADGIHAMKSTLRDEAGFKGLRGSNVNRIYGKIAKAASDDMITSLKQAGKEDAAQALKTADDFWAKRVETIDTVLEPVLGKNTAKTGAQIVTALERMAKEETGNSANLRRLLNALPKTEAQNIRATVIQRMGVKKAGQEGEEAFSLQGFLTRYNEMSPQAKDILFKGGARKALDDLATIAKADRDAGRFLNTSNTARAVGVQAGLAGLVGYLIDPVTAGGVAASQFALGKLLASPRFARWLARAPKEAGAQKRHIQKLTAIAAEEPIIANDLKSVQGFLGEQISRHSGRAAASDEQRRDENE